MACRVDDGVVVVKDAVGKVIGAEILPDLLDRIEFRGARVLRPRASQGGGAEQVGVLVALVGGLDRSRTARSVPDETALADPGLILEPDLGEVFFERLDDPAASARLIPSSTAAIGGNRRLRFESFVETARRRSCTGGWLDLISTLRGMADPPHHLESRLPQYGKPPERRTRGAVGITCLVGHG